MSKTIDTVIDNLVTDVKDLLDFGADLAKDAADRVIDLVSPPEKSDAEPTVKTEPTPQEKIANLIGQLDPEAVVAALKLLAKTKGSKK